MQLVDSCKFDVEDPSSYNSHQQVARLFCDLATQNASSLTSAMPAAELTRIWLALIRLLRYPSAGIQADALTGMVALTRQGLGATGTVRMDLEQLTGVLHVLSLKINEGEKMGEQGNPSLSNDRSAWLLRCLGPISGQQNCQTFAGWCHGMKISASFDILETDFSGQQIQAQRLGRVKVHSKELLSEICRRAPQSGAKVSPENCNFSALCRVAGGLVARSLAGDEMDMGSMQSWVEEFDSAISLVESAASAALKLAEKDGPPQFLEAVVQSMLAFLQQVCVKTAESLTIERRRLEFLSACSGFYKHWPQEVLRDVLARVVSHIRAEQSPVTRGIKLEQRALDTLVAISKSGSVEVSSFKTSCLMVSFGFKDFDVSCSIQTLLMPSSQCRLGWNCMKPPCTSSFPSPQIGKSHQLLLGSAHSSWNASLPSDTIGGVLKAQHLESLNGECNDLAQRVSSASGRSNSLRKG